MPNTSFEEIYQEFLSKVQDYKMRNLFLSDVNVATNLLHSYLLKAIAKFTNCRKDIKNPDEKKGEFNVSLNLVEKDILTGLMVEAWMDRVILDITQMNLTLNDNDWGNEPLVWYIRKLLYFKPLNCWNFLRDKYTTT